MKLHIKPKKYVKRVLCSLLIVILLFVVVSVAGSAVAFRVIYPRSLGYDDFTLRYSDLDADRYPRERLTFDSSGESLTAYLYRTDEPSALVVTAAGIGGGASSHLSEATRFVDEGWDVFCYDAAGVGESSGAGVIGLSRPAVDLRAALDYISGIAELKQLPILLYSHSAGGYAAATCCGEYDRVKAAVIISAFESPVSLMYASARERVGLLADIEYPFMVLENAMLFNSNADIKASDRLSGCDIPIMIFEGKDDAIIPESQRLSNYSDKIKNPRISYTIVDEPYRSGHSDLWLSDEASRYRASHTESDDLPDRLLANKLDDSFIDTVITFYQNSLTPNSSLLTPNY